jgi:hypothetical protein
MARGDLSYWTTFMSLIQTASRRVAAKAFQVLQVAGISVVPNHFYWPIPYVRGLPEAKWSSLSELVGIDLGLDRQLDQTADRLQFLAPEMEFPAAKNSDPCQFHLNNGFFESVDAEVAYSTVRHQKPRFIIEIGSGYTTRLLASAVRKNVEEGTTTELISIDPYPGKVVYNGFDGLEALIRKPIQEIPVDFFNLLGHGDILFLDSSHVVSINSDVNYEILEILPRLAKGVIVHFHDIFLPAEYPRKFVTENLCFWGEQYLLQAFLAFNCSFEVLWASSALQFARRQTLERLFRSWPGSYERLPTCLTQLVPTLDGHNTWPCSFWVRKRT